MKRYSYAELSNTLYTMKHCGIVGDTRVKYQRNGRTFYGTRCRLDRVLSDTEKAFFSGAANNITFGSAVYRYAPEQKTSTIILWDNTTKTVFNKEAQA